MDQDEIERGMRAQRDYEALVTRYLDEVLVPRGFKLTPQGFATDPHGNLHHSAIYEATPEEYGRRYPSLAARFRGEVPCIDLWVELDSGKGQITCRLEGDSLTDLLREGGHKTMADSLAGSRDSSLEAQLLGLSEAISTVFNEAEN